MTSRIEYRGRMFDDSTDWLDYLRDLARSPGRHGELRDDAPTTASALTDVASTLQDTTLFDRFADAAISLIESGSSDEIEVVHALPVGDTGGRRRRLLAAVRRRRDILGSRRAAAILATLLEADPADPEVTLAAREELLREDHQASLALRYARTDLDWILANLRTVLPPEPLKLAGLAARNYPRGSDRVLEAVARAGDEYGRALGEGLAMLARPGEPAEAVLEQVRRHPVLARFTTSPR